MAFAVRDVRSLEVVSPISHFRVRALFRQGTGTCPGIRRQSFQEVHLFPAISRVRLKAGECDPIG